VVLRGRAEHKASLPNVNLSPVRPNSGRLTEARDGDLLLQGSPIAKATPAVRQLGSSISYERFRASNWLRGYHELYSETPTDT
jgi:hypothetical protein